MLDAGKFRDFWRDRKTRSRNVDRGKLERITI
jgi:hypothetical protein